jgi:hypothetical protein
LVPDNLLTTSSNPKSAKSIKLWWNNGLLERGEVLGVLFGERDETVKVVKLLVDRMKEETTLSITRRQLRFFANELNSGTLGVRYSYHNFYTKLVRKLLLLGLLEKDMIWNPEQRTTVKVYQLVLQSIPDRPPQGGFIKQAWQIAKGWNNLIQRPG